MQKDLDKVKRRSVFYLGRFVVNLILIFFVSNILMANESSQVKSGSVCLGRNLSKVLEETWVQVGSSQSYRVPSGETAFLIDESFDLDKKHLVKIYTKSPLEEGAAKLVSSWRFIFSEGGSNMVSIFRTVGGWQLVQNKKPKCEFPTEGCSFRYFCKP